MGSTILLMGPKRSQKVTNGAHKVITGPKTYQALAKRNQVPFVSTSCLSIHAEQRPTNTQSYYFCSSSLESSAKIRTSEHFLLLSSSYRPFPGTARPLLATLGTTAPSEGPTLAVDGHGSLRVLTDVQEAAYDGVVGRAAVDEEEVVVVEAGVGEALSVVDLLVQADDGGHAVLPEVGEVSLGRVQRVTCRGQSVVLTYRLILRLSEIIWKTSAAGRENSLFSLIQRPWRLLNLSYNKLGNLLLQHESEV